ncbi:MAG: molybdopterin cofactor-binding domain-containing protein [Gammaproteobacteria bacterium]|jgi:CO/xanthine dehydrogenase Mo-binding subunit|nr:molybdopterin cofactor-binding domain-containing protein [Gammaproteobacteria bacterium]
MTPPLPRQAGVSRRGFLLGVAGVAGGGLALTWWPREPERLLDDPAVLEPNAFLQVHPDGRVIFQLDKAEMGQGVMTGLVTLVAEELDYDPARIEVQFAPVRRTFQRPLMLTGQSLSMADSWDILRATGATARAMLLAAAARRWDCDAAALRTRDGQIIHPESSQRLTYADLASEAAQQPVPRNVPLKQPQDYRWIGTDVPRLDLEAKVRGAAQYGMDVRRPGMLTAVVARVPELRGTLRGFDGAAARAVPGVVELVALPHGVAVIARDFWTAQRAARLVKLDAAPGPLAAVSDADIEAQEAAQLERTDPDVDEGSAAAAAALATAATMVDATYRTPYLAHAPMEPMNATVHVQPGRCDLWLPTQAPDMARSVAADIAGLPRAQVHVHSTFIGGGFGRRVLMDFVAEAVQIAAAVDAPVQLIWTREDDMRHGFFRQRTVHQMRGGLDAEGAPVAWAHRQVATPTVPSLMNATVNVFLPEVLSAAQREGIGNWMAARSVQFVAAFQAREGAEELPYALPSQAFTQFAYDPGVPVSIWRSVGNSYNAFAVESFIDELAAAAGSDPAEYRRALLRDPRHVVVLDRALAAADWSAPLPAGRARGLAFVSSFGTHVAQVAEVSLDGQQIRVHRVVCAVDCGQIVNPDIVRQQMEGGVIFGLTAALYGEINIDQGRVRQGNYNSYRMLTLRDAPDVEVELVPTAEAPTGVGEPGVPPIAPAVANAVFALTGQRLRSLPLRLE